MFEKIGCGYELRGWFDRLTGDAVRCMQVFQLLRMLAPIVVGVVLTKLIASRSELGVYEAVIFGLTMCTFFWVSALLRGVLVLAGRMDGKPQEVLLGSLFWLLCGVGGVVCVLLLLFRGLLEGGLFGVLVHGQYYVLCGLVLLSAPTFMIEYVYFIRDKGGHLLMYGLLLVLGQVVVSCVPVWWGYGIEMSLYGLLVLQVLKLLWVCMLLGRHIFLFSQDVAISLWVLSAPLMLSFLMATGADYVDGILILHFGSAGDFVLFRYSARELPVSVAFCTALSSAMLLPLSRDMRCGMAELRERSLRLMHLLFPLSAGLILGSRWLFPLVYNGDYSDGAFIFNIFSLLLISRVVFPQTVLTALNCTGVQFWITLFELLLNASLSFVLFGYMGLEGVAWGTCIAFGIEKALLAGYLYRNYGIAPSKYIPLGWYIFYVGLLLGVFMLVYFFR